MMTSEILDAFFRDGWNGHDVDVLMRFMTDDCVFESAAGPDPCGERHLGRAQVRKAFARIFATYPDATFRDVRHLVAGDRGVSEWVFTGAGVHGRTIAVNGCDLFTFENAKIAVKSSFFKQRTA